MIPSHLRELSVFGTGTARRAGVSDFELQRAVGAGEVIRLKRGWYTAQRLEWPADRHRLRVELALRERTNVVASHYSAAVAYGFPVHRPDWGTVHVMRTVDGGARSRRGLVVHRRVPDVVLGRALAIAQTTLACAVSGLMALDAALRSGAVTLPEVVAAAQGLAGLPGSGRLPMVLRLGDGRRESPLESWAALTYDGWELPLEPQFEVPGTRFRADGRIIGTRVLVEADGQGKYVEPGASLREKLREDDLRARGWEAVRVTHDLLDQPKVLLARTRRSLALAATGDAA